MAELEEQVATANQSRALTFRRIVAIGVIGLSTVLVAILYVPRINPTAPCFEAMRNLNSALVLYRADNDGYSPSFNKRSSGLVEASLQEYAAGKSIFCKYNTPGFKGIYCLRLVSGARGSKNYVLLDGDNSVMALCAGHEKQIPRFIMNGWKPMISWRIDAKNPGTITVLLRSGAVKSISPNNRPETWVVRNGTFERMDYSKMTSTPGYPFSLYDFEPKPPKFEY